MAYGSIKYRVECLVCGKQFTVSTVQSKIPKHPPKGVLKVPNMPYIPCAGSGQTGAFIESKIEGLS